MPLLFCAAYVAGLLSAPVDTQSRGQSRGGCSCQCRYARQPRYAPTWHSWPASSWPPLAPPPPLIPCCLTVRPSSQFPASQPPHLPASQPPSLPSLPFPALLRHDCSEISEMGGGGGGVRPMLTGEMGCLLCLFRLQRDGGGDVCAPDPPVLTCWFVNCGRTS